MSQNSRMKNKNMAADMKRKGVERTTQRCPMPGHNHLISNAQLMNHLRGGTR